MPISESFNCNFSFTCGMYKTQVPIIKFNEAKIQATEKYLNFDKIILREYILKYLIFFESSLHYILKELTSLFFKW